MNEHDEAVGLKFLLDRYPEIYQSKLNKYLIALADSDLDDAENATYNLKRSIDEDNFEIFKIIHAKYPDLDYKFSFDYVHSVVFFDYYTNVLQIPFDCVNNMNIIRSAIEFYKDDLLDKIWGKCDPNEVPDILNTIRKDVFSFDNLYAFKKLSELIDPENLMIAIESNAPKILEYLLTQNIEIKYKEDVIESLLANIENVYIGENFVQEEADKYKKRTSQIVSLLDQDGLLDRDFIKEYILENIDDKMEDMVKLLNYISFDSRTQLEISAAFDTAMTPKLDLLKKLARKAVE